MIPPSYSRRPRFPPSRQHEAVRYARACHTDMTRRLFQASEFGGDKSISPMGGVLRGSRAREGRTLTGQGALPRQASWLLPGRHREGLSLDERLFDHEMAGLVAGALDEIAALEHQFQLFEHRRAAAHHDAVGLDVERTLADVVEDLLGAD